MMLQMETQANHIIIDHDVEATIIPTVAFSMFALA